MRAQGGFWETSKLNLAGALRREDEVTCSITPRGPRKVQRSADITSSRLWTLGSWLIHGTGWGLLL